MNQYKITYKAASAYSSLPTEIEADSYRTQGKFIDFMRHGDIALHTTAEILHRVSADAVVHIELTKEGE